MNAIPQLPDEEEADEAEFGDGDDGRDPECLYDGETYLYGGRESVCEEFGLLGFCVRDGFLYCFSVGEGEVLFGDFLKKRAKSGAVKAIK